jgi:hypothetical protein
LFIFLFQFTDLHEPTLGIPTLEEREINKNGPEILQGLLNNPVLFWGCSMEWVLSKLINSICQELIHSDKPNKL